MSLSNPSALWFLLILPLIVVVQSLELLSYRNMRKQAGLGLKGGGRSQVFVFRWVISTLLFLVSVASLILALSGPHWGEEYVEQDIEGTETILVLDISRSMLVNDLQPHRLGRAKEIITGLLSDLPEGSQALVAVKGSAELVVPLTFDKVSLVRQLSLLSPDSIKAPGTQLGEGLLLALQAFQGGSRAYKSIILVSDGGDKSGEASLFRSARILADQGISLLIVGVGSLEGGFIPGESTGGGLKLPLASDRLKRAAEYARGTYIGVEDAALYNRLAAIVLQQVDEQSRRGFKIQSKSQEGIFVGLALLCLMLIPLIKGIRWRFS